MAYPEKKRRGNKYTLYQYQLAWEIVDKYYRSADKAMNRLLEIPPEERPDWYENMLQRWIAVRAGLKWVSHQIKKHGEQHANRSRSSSQSTDTVLPVGVLDGNVQDSE